MAQISTLRLFSLASLFALRAFAAVTVESLAAVPAGWTHTETPSDSQTITLQVALKLQNLDQLESKLMTISDPDSPNYGQFMDLNDVDALFGPTENSFKAVADWLESSGVTEYKQQGSSIWLQTTVGNANKLLGTTFKTYTDRYSVSKVRTTSYAVPDSIASHIDVIAPTTYFGKSSTQRSSKIKKRAIEAFKPLSRHRYNRRDIPSSCHTTINYHGHAYAAFDPDCLKTIYNIGSYKPDASSGSKIAFSSFLNQSASFSDLTAYEQHFGFPNQNFSVVLVNKGATDLPQPPDPANIGEANLDVQNIISIANPLPVTEYITAGSPPYFPDPSEPAGTPNENEPYLPYYEYLLTQPNSALPQVISNSYGDDEQTVPQDYATRVCALIGIMGLRGISVLESSGDEGVGAACLSQDGKRPEFNPIFPATCPYVTAVGGTVSFAPEIAWEGSSGGFSSYFPQPWYQKDAVNSYLAKVDPAVKKYYSSYTNFAGRGFPDLAAHSVSPDYSVFEAGSLAPSGGTSAASPIVASIVALLNDARLKKKLPSLGFLNPYIYKAFAMGVGFTDITGGQAVGCNGNNTQTGAPVAGAGVIPGAFWNATVGWDPATGVGTPDFGALLKLAT